MIWIARHGNREDFVNPDWKQTAKRKHDSCLSSDGAEQARLLGKRLKGEGVRYIISSPYLRAVETANYVAEELDLPIYVEEGLGELLKIEWFESKPEVLGMEELTEKFPRVKKDYRSGVVPRYPESSEDFCKRMGKTVELLIQRFENEFLVVGHGASVVGFIRTLLGSEVVVQCALCSLSKIQANSSGDWEWVFNGDTSHLESNEGADRFI